jgi:hypothetical protein
VYPSRQLWQHVIHHPLPLTLLRRLRLAVVRGQGRTQALITYALDLLLPSKGEAVGEPEDRVRRSCLRADRCTDCQHHLLRRCTFAFWLARRVPHAFRSRKTVLTDIASIWLQTNEATPEDHRERLNFPRHRCVHRDRTAPCCGQWWTAETYGLHTPEASERRPREGSQPTNDDLHDGHDPKPRYIDPGPRRHERDQVESIVDALFSSSGDLEKGAMEEDIIDTRIYSALILLKLSPTVELDIERVKGLIVQTEEAIGNPSVGTLGSPGNLRLTSGVDLDRKDGRRSISQRCFSSSCLATRGGSISKGFGRGYGRCWGVKGYPSWVISGAASSRWAWMCRS